MLLSRIVYIIINYMNCLCTLQREVNAQFDSIPTISNVSNVFEVTFEFQLFYVTKANSKTVYQIYSEVMYFDKISALVQ